MLTRGVKASSEIRDKVGLSLLSSSHSSVPSIYLSSSNLCNSLTASIIRHNARNVPVLPIPALQWVRIGVSGWLFLDLNVCSSKKFSAQILTVWCSGQNHFLKQMGFEGGEVLRCRWRKVLSRNVKIGPLLNCVLLQGGLKGSLK